MKYFLEITSSAQRQFKKLPIPVQESITPRILALELNPRPHGVKKLKMFEYYRIRVGDYRVIFAINDRKEVVKVLDIGHRKDIYR